MTTYIIKRLLTMIPTFLGITLITFFMIRLAPGDPTSLKLGIGEGLRAEGLSPEIIEQSKRLHGLIVDLPEWYENFIHKATTSVHGDDPKEKPHLTRRALDWVGQTSIQYTAWLSLLMRFEFGYSSRDYRPVSEKILEALPVTLTLNFISIFIIYFVSIPLGVYTATKKDRALDRISMLLLFILYSLPSFWVATLLIKFLSVDLGWFPLTGLMSFEAENAGWLQKFFDMAWHLTLPLVVLVYGGFAFLTRFSRNNMLEVIRQDYMRTARAKGLSERKVIWKHGFRNSLIALLTLMGTLLPAMLGGSIIVEEIFAIPGMGRLGFQSVLARDYQTIMAITTISAFLTLLSLLLSDLSYTWADPRINFEKRESH